jgi:hypothetical protein
MLFFLYNEQVKMPFFPERTITADAKLVKWLSLHINLHLEPLAFLARSLKHDTYQSKLSLLCITISLLHQYDKLALSDITFTLKQLRFLFFQQFQD